MRLITVVLGFSLVLCGGIVGDGRAQAPVRSFEVLEATIPELQAALAAGSVTSRGLVGMYLARQLTGLPLNKIGEFFGGRDHSTVLHACRKVEQALADDVALSGLVRQLHADLA